MKKRKYFILNYLMIVFFLGGIDSVGLDLRSDGQALAVVGAPVTPGSYAGMARRTSRRTSRRTATRVSSANQAQQSSSLPSGCAQIVVSGLTYENCNGIYYLPKYNGTNVVYQQVPDPHSAHHG